MNHPHLLAFEVMAQPDEYDADEEPRYHTVTARNTAELTRLLGRDSPWCILAVHHISDEDDFTITDIVWNINNDLTPYDDHIAELSFERQREPRVC